MALTTAAIERIRRERAHLTGGMPRNAAAPKFFEGGIMSDVFDALSVGAYATGGLLSGVGIKEGIKNRVLPSQAFEIKNPVLAFAVDVALDPTTYLSGGTTKLGALNRIKGVEKVLSGSKAIAGEKALVNISVPFVKSLQGIPLIGKGGLPGTAKIAETFYDTASRSKEALKQFGKKYGLDASQYFGGRPALSLEAPLFGKGRITTEAMESRAALTKANQSKLGRLRVFSQARRAEDQDRIALLENKAANIIKANNLGDDALRAFRKRLEDGVTKIPKAMDEVFNESKTLLNELGDRWALADGSILEGKVFPVVAKSGIDRELAGFANSREFGGKSASELFSSYTNFTSGDGKVIGGMSRSGKRATLVDGQDLVEFEDGLYVPRKVFDAVTKQKGELQKLVTAIEEVQKQGGKVNEATLSRMEDLKHAAETLDFDYIKGNAPETIFKRTAPTVEEFEQIAKRFGQNIEVEKDPFRLMQLRSNRVVKKQAAHRFIEEAKTMGVKIKGGEIPPGYATSTHSALKGYAFPEEIVSHMDNTYTSFTSLKAVGKVLETIDKIQNFWKGSATFVNFAFHTRNMVSNMWQLHLAGVDNPKWIAQGMDTMIRKKMSAWQQGKRLFDVTDTRPIFKTADGMKSERQLYTEFVSQALGGTGRFTADMEGLVARLQNNKIFKAGGALGAAIEDSSKFALFAQRRATMGVEQAADEVRKFLFDYTDLTDFERVWMRRFFPFYSWTRKNIPLQLAMLIENPSKFTQISKFKDAIENNANGEPMDERYMPDWLKEAYPIYFGTSPDGMKKYFKLEGFIPAVDINQIGRPGEMFWEQMSPFIKTPAEMFMNYDSFKEKQIEEFEGQKKKFFGTYMDPKLEFALSKIRPINELNKLFGLGDLSKIPSAKARFWTWFFSRSYQFDVTSQRRFFDILKAQTLSQINKDIEKARGKGDDARVRSLRTLQQEVSRGEHLSL